jgi:hypothetical protein
MRKLFKYFLIDAICTFTFLILKIFIILFRRGDYFFLGQFSKNEDYFHRSKKAFLWKHEFWKRKDIFRKSERFCVIIFSLIEFQSTHICQLAG